MWCALSRWMISRAADTGRRPPRSVERHIGRCGACGEYARFAASLKDRFAAGRPAFLAAVPEFPPSAAVEDRAATRIDERPSFGRRLLLHPLPAAAGVLAFAAAALFLVRVVLREPASTPEDRAAAQAAIRSIFAAPGGFRGALTEAESSLDRERRVWERSLASAAEYLQARLNIRIERKGSPKDL